MLGALSKGISKLDSPLHAADTDLFMDALRSIGVPIECAESWANIHGSNSRFAGGSTVNLGDPKKHRFVIQRLGNHNDF